MKISQMGEDRFIQIVKDTMNQRLGEGVVGIEDDCAVVPLMHGKLMLLSTDSLVEGCHFLKEKIAAVDLGYKAVMVNVSDIGAMGGKGLYVLMAIALPSDIEESWLIEYLQGVKTACEEVGLVLIGGDTTGSKDSIFINFTIVGEVDNVNIKYRKDAKVGDLVCLTAPIGDAFAGFHLMLAGETTENPLVKKHCRPKAQYDEGLWLGGQSAVHAMMDLSDGLKEDLARMVAASHVGAEVDFEFIPMSKKYVKFSEKYSLDTVQQAIVSGEEYSLLFTVGEDEFKQVNSEFSKRFGGELFVIGRIVEGEGVAYLKEGKPIEIKSKAYNHFKE